MARKKKAVPRKREASTAHGVRCPPEMSKFIDSIREKFRVDRSDVWRWAMTVAQREFVAGRVTGPGEPGMPQPVIKEAAHVA